MMIIGFIGGIGSGKTLSMTRVLHGDHLNKRTIFTNYGLKFEDMSRIIELDKTFFDNYAKSRFNIEHSSVAIDEAHVFIDSRSAMNKKNKMFSKFITQSRKRGVDMYYTTQESSIESFRVSGQVDLRLRKLTDYMVFCKGVWLKGIFYACNDWYDQSYKYLGNKLFAGNHYFNLYDTNQIIDIDED